MRIFVGLPALLMSVACTVPGQDTSQTSQASTMFSSTVMGLIPSAYWRLGDTGSTLYDFGYSANDGEYENVTLGVSNAAILGDLNTAVSFWGKSTSFGEVPDSSIHSLTQAWDDFFCPNIPQGCENPNYGGGWLASGRYYAEDYGPYWVMEEGASPMDNFYLEVHDDLSSGVFDLRDNNGVLQQGLPVGLLNGDMQIRATWTDLPKDGPFEPIALVARRQDRDNFVRAELVLYPDRHIDLRLVRTANGTDYILANAYAGYWNGGWWYLRFQFDGVRLRARAWANNTPQQDCVPNPTPDDCWLVNGEYAQPQYGTIALRSSNLTSSTSPKVHVANFWAQHLGLTVHMFVMIPPGDQEGLEDGKKYLHLLGKGSRYSSSIFGEDGNQEYYFRYTPDSDNRDIGTLRAYVFNLEGEVGAGQAVEHVRADTWYQVVMQLDSGDALDRNAGVTMYVNGRTDLDGDLVTIVDPRVPRPGAWYDGTRGCDDDGQFPLAPPQPGHFGHCEPDPIDGDTKCLNWSDGKVHNCWKIFPKNGDAPFRFGTVNKKSWFRGTLDEVIIFERKLKDYEVMSLYQTSQ